MNEKRNLSALPNGFLFKLVRMIRLMICLWEKKSFFLLKKNVLLQYILIVFHSQKKGAAGKIENKCREKVSICSIPESGFCDPLGSRQKRYENLLCTAEVNIMVFGFYMWVKILLANHEILITTFNH